MVASAFGDMVGCGDWDMGSGLVGFRGHQLWCLDSDGLMVETLAQNKK